MGMLALALTRLGMLAVLDQTAGAAVVVVVGRQGSTAALERQVAAWEVRGVRILEGLVAGLVVPMAVTPGQPGRLLLPEDTPGLVGAAESSGHPQACTQEMLEEALVEGGQGILAGLALEVTLTGGMERAVS